MKKLFAAFGALIVSLVPAAANPVTPAVKIACKSDYLKHCSMHTPGSEGVRNCMASVFGQLSTRCVDAIIASPLAETDASRVKNVSQAVVQKVEKKKARYAAKKKAKGMQYASAKKKGLRYASFGKKGKKYASKAKRRDMVQRSKSKGWKTVTIKAKRGEGAIARADMR